MRLLIFDLDNCLSDDQWRHHLIIEGDYHAYSSAAWADQFHSPHRSFFVGGYTIVICTGRSDRYRELTVKWLTKWQVPWSILLMRPEGDNRPSAELKPELLSCVNKSWIQIAYDDRDDVLFAYERAGIPCRKLVIHEISKEELRRQG